MLKETWRPFAPNFRSQKNSRSLPQENQVDVSLENIHHLQPTGKPWAQKPHTNGRKPLELVMVTIRPSGDPWAKAAVSKRPPKARTLRKTKLRGDMSLIATSQTVGGLGISEPSTGCSSSTRIRDSNGRVPVKPILLPYCWWLTRNPARKILTSWELVVEILIILPGFLATSKGWLSGISEPSTVGHLPTRSVPLHLPLWLYIMFWFHAAFSLEKRNHHG